MSLLAFCTGMWVVTSALGAYVNPSAFTSFTLSLVYVFGALLITALLHLTIVFPYPFVRFDKLHAILLYLPAIIFSLIALVTKTIVKDYIVNPSIPGVIVSGPLHHLYNYFVLGFFLLSLMILFLRISRTDGIHRQNVKVVFWSIFLGGSLPVWVDLLIPNFFPQMYVQTNFLYGNIATVVWLGLTSYIVLKK